MLVSLTVGKVDAGVAVLLTEDKRLIEFPSILLPPSITTGSIVDITVARNFASEAASQKSFASLQENIYSTFGQHTPSPPTLRCRNATQTSVVLEWDPINLATAELRSLSLYRNGSKAGSIPRPFENTSTKISGLAVDTEYSFQLVLRTSAGTYSSQKLVVNTHKMTDLSGITITPGPMPQQLKQSLLETANRVGAKVIDSVRIDTTHFVCTEGRGPLWERAVEMNIPVVVPDWLKGVEREGRLVRIKDYYLDADPRMRQVGSSSQQQQAQRPSTPGQPPGTPTTQVIPPTPDRANANGDTALQESLKSPPPPTPPPKAEQPERDPEAQKIATSVEEPKARTEDVKPPNEKEADGEESDSSEDTQTGPGRETAIQQLKRTESEIQAVAAVDRAEREEKGENGGDSASFHDVAL